MTSWNARTNRILLALTLYIKSKQSVENEVKEINLELNVYEVESLLNKLKDIKKSLKI